MTLITLTEPLTHIKCGGNDTIYFFMPRDFVEQRIVDGEALCARRTQTSSGIQRLARDTIVALQREALSGLSSEEFRAVACVAGDLLLLALAGDGDLLSNARSVRAGNLARAKRVMRARLSSPDLTLSDVAEECGLSLRYLHELFRNDGRTAASFLLGERLQRARRILQSSERRSGLITEVSMTCGFSSPSQFATTFRRAFGISPTDAIACSAFG